MIRCVEKVGKKPFFCSVSPKALGKEDKGIWKKHNEYLNTMSPPLMDKDEILAPLMIWSGMTYCR